MKQAAHQPEQQYQDDQQENENGDPVHPMHQPEINAAGRLGVPLFQVKIFCNLPPDAHATKVGIQE
jgi:hypothetical protein